MCYEELFLYILFTREFQNGKTIPRNKMYSAHHTCIHQSSQPVEEKLCNVQYLILYSHNRLISCFYQACRFMETYNFVTVHIQGNRKLVPNKATINFSVISVVTLDGCIRWKSNIYIMSIS